jgi:hypothetical protein
MDSVGTSAKRRHLLQSSDAGCQPGRSAHCHAETDMPGCTDEAGFALEPTTIVARGGVESHAQTSRQKIPA